MSLKFSLITIAIRFILLQVCPSRRASFCMCCVIYTLFSCFERLFLCFARFGGISYCLNFDKLPDTASLSSRRKQPTLISRRHHWFSREMTSEKRAQKFHADDASDLGSVSDWLKQISHTSPPILKKHLQLWVVTRHHYGISVLVSQT